MSWDRDKERKAGGAYHMGINIFGLIFAIFWCAAAASMGAGFMLIFGIPFVGMMIFRLVMCAKAMKGEEKKPTEPWDQPPRQEPPTPNTAGSYCPYCGSSVNGAFQFCPHCGRRLTQN